MTGAHDVELGRRAAPHSTGHFWQLSDDLQEVLTRMVDHGLLEGTFSEETEDINPWTECTHARARPPTPCRIWRAEATRNTFRTHFVGESPPVQ